MKILHIIPYLNPKRGGDVYVCHMICKYLHQRGHNVTILTTNFDADNKFIQMIRNEGISVVTIPYVICYTLFIYSPDMKKWIHHNIKDFDIIHCHNFRSYQNMQIAYLAQRYKIPFIIQTHGDIPYSEQKTFLKKIYDFFIGNQTLSKAGKIFVLTDDEKKFLKYYSIDFSKIVLIPNGVEYGEGDTICINRGNFKKRLGLQDNIRIILYIGRLHQTKGLDLLVNAFYLVCKLRKDVTLVIIGPDYGFKETIQSLIDTNKLGGFVHLLDYVDNKTKFSAYCDSDIFVTPKYSGFPITFLESCLAGLPIITTTKGDRLGWIHDQVGMIVDYREDSIANAILSLLDNDLIRIQYSMNCRKLVKEQFSWDIIVKKIENEYFMMIDSIKNL